MALGKESISESARSGHMLARTHAHTSPHASNIFFR